MASDAYKTEDCEPVDEHGMCCVTPPPADKKSKSVVRPNVEKSFSLKDVMSYGWRMPTETTDIKILLWISIGVVTIGVWVPGHPHFLSVIFSGVVAPVPVNEKNFVGTASKHSHPGTRHAHFKILSTPMWIS
jgi:hypothetical protein